MFEEPHEHVGEPTGTAAVCYAAYVPLVGLDFASEEEAQAALDAWLTRHDPPKVQTDLAGFEAAHLAGFLAEYGRSIRHLYIGFDQLVALVDEVNFIDKRDWPQHRALQFILIAKNLKPFHSAIDRLTKGSYQDAMTLTRGPYETFLRVVHVSIYSENPWGALSVQSGKGVPTFNATGLARDVLGLDWRKYGIMSPFTHSNLFEVLQALKRQEQQQGEAEQFGLNYEDDPTLVEAVLPLLQFLVLAYLRFVREVLIGSAEVRDPSQLPEVDQAIEWAAFLLRANPKPYWMQVVADLDYILEVLGLADHGEDWKAVRDRREPVTERTDTEGQRGT